MEDDSSSNFGTFERCMTNVSRYNEKIMLAVPPRK
jgi:hypothetical protein